MKRWFLAGSAMTLSLLLSGCGGGGDGVASTPPPTYTKLADLSGNQTFQSAGVGYKISNGTLPSYSTQKFGAGVTIAYTASTDSYTLTAPDGATDTFSSSTNVPPPGFTPTPNVLTLFNSAGGTFSLSTPTLNGVAMSYLAMGSWDHLQNGAESYYLAVSGVPTIASDMPKSGTANYQTAVHGVQIQAGAIYDLSTASTATFSADFGAGTIATTLHLAGSRYNPVTMTTGTEPPTDWGSYTGSGTIASGGPGFSGTLTSTPSSSVSASGEFAGAFFGPQAKEMGYTWLLNAPSILRAQGVAVGTK
jgi:hypothetical protein